jgi:hypothetical protein
MVDIPIAPLLSPYPAPIDPPPVSILSAPKNMVPVLLAFIPFSSLTLEKDIIPTSPNGGTREMEDDSEEKEEYFKRRCMTFIIIIFPSQNN